MTKLKHFLDLGDAAGVDFPSIDLDGAQLQEWGPFSALLSAGSPDPGAAAIDEDAVQATAATGWSFGSNVDLADRDSFPFAALASNDISASLDVQATPATSGATAQSQTAANGVAIPIGSANEVAFLSGVTAAGKVAGTSFSTWNDNTPATYNSTNSDAAKWGSSTLSPTGTPGGTVTYWFDATSNWSTTEKNALASGLALWSAEANINFAMASSAASANFIFYRGSDGSAYQTFGTQSITHVGNSTDGTPGSTGSYIHIDTSVGGFGPIGGSFSLYGGYAYETLVHEEGHMLGLGHGGPYNGTVNAKTQQFSAYDTRLWSLMSYIDPWTTTAKYYSNYPVTGTNWGVSPDGYYYEPTTPMILDVLAAQQLYGPAISGPLASGGQVFGFHSNVSGLAGQYFDFTINSHPVISIWDGGLHNTLDLSGFAAGAMISLAPGTFTSANGEINNIGIAEGTTIETAVGGTGNDTFVGFAGSHTYVGGAGNDTMSYAAISGAFTLLTYNGTIAALASGIDDRLQTIENIQFTDKTVLASVVAQFDAYEYLAGYPDLILAIGNNPLAAFNHYADHGYSEGRSLTAFDGWEYLASNPTLIHTLGPNPDAAAQNYVVSGYNSRLATDSFDAWDYLASYPDLIRGFGANPVAAEQHYVTFGYNEGRTSGNFDAWEYLASYPDLIRAFGSNTEAAEQHYVAHGYSEGRVPDLFDGWEYLASNPGLISIAGTNAEAAAENYVTQGYSGGLSLNSFDSLEYIASYPDLIKAFGTNIEAGAEHYVAHGISEGRVPAIFNAEQYLANYADLQAGYGDNPDAAAAHFIANGINEGRTDYALPGTTLGVFVGNANANTMQVGTGDTMTGGGGADTFVFNSSLASPATITDFTHGTDVLQISAAGFGDGLVGSVAAAVVSVASLALGTHAGAGGYFVFENAGPSAGLLLWDATGGSATDATPLVQLQHVTSLLSSDLHIV